ncbi:MAG: class I SAM-dependent methyltransferase [Reichenbachiella sp.]
MSKNYMGIVDHYENCFEQHGDTAKGVDWPNENDANRRYQVMLEVIKASEKFEKEISLLDFGCGTASLNSYIKLNKYSPIKYSGLDLGSNFLNAAKKKFPSCDFYNTDILEPNSSLPTFDYIIANGVFTEKRELSFDEMVEYFKKMILALKPFYNKGLAFNVMSKAVDWERWDLFHLPTDLLIEFLVQRVGRNFIIRNDYGLYEYTVYLYK